MKPVALLLCGLGLGCASPVPSDGGDWEERVRAAEERHRQAFLANDEATLNSIIADDFVVNSPQNRIVEKTELLGMVQRGLLSISTFEQNLESIRRFGDIAVVMGEDRVVYAAPSPSAGQTQRRRFTDLWQLRDTTWKFIARQASVVP